MERNEVSMHELKVYAALKKRHSKWATHADIYQDVADVSPRTIRAHVLKFVRLGLVDQAEVFPAHRYRLSDKAEKRNKGYVTRLETAAEVFGIEVSP
jgi:hypothetical protein